MPQAPHSTATLSQALEGIAFPCGKAGIVEYARAHDADPAALDVLAGIRDQDYASLEEVMKGVGLAHGHTGPPFPKPEKAGEPPRPLQPQRAEARPFPTEAPEPATLEGQIEAAHPHATDLPPQPAREPQQPGPARRRGLLAGLRRMLGLG